MEARSEWDGRKGANQEIQAPIECRTGGKQCWGSVMRKVTCGYSINNCILAYCAYSPHNSLLPTYTNVHTHTHTHTYTLSQPLLSEASCPS